MSEVKPTMILISAPWQGKKSFKLMPVDKDCPFNEAIFDVDSKILVMLSTQVKESIHMMPKLDTKGDMVILTKPRLNGKKFKEQRVNLETFTEHYIVEIEEIENLIKLFAINANSFDYKKYLVESKIIMPETPKLEIIT